MTSPFAAIEAEIMAHLNNPFTELEMNAWYIAVAVAMDIKARRIRGLRCHEMARAAARIFEMEVQDGAVGGLSRTFSGIEHSWLWTKTGFPGFDNPIQLLGWKGNILDPCVQGGFPPAQLVSGHLAVGLIGRHYRPGPMRDDINEALVDEIEARFREVMARGGKK
jgi:hypothetical protein